MLRFDLRDSSDTFIVVKGTINVGVSRNATKPTKPLTANFRPVLEITPAQKRFLQQPLPGLK